MRLLVLVNMKRFVHEKVHIELFEIDHLNQKDKIVSQPGEGQAIEPDWMRCCELQR